MVAAHCYPFADNSREMESGFPATEPGCFDFYAKGTKVRATFISVARCFCVRFSPPPPAPPRWIPSSRARADIALDIMAQRSSDARS